MDPYQSEEDISAADETVELLSQRREFKEEGLQAADWAMILLVGVCLAGVFAVIVNT